MNKIKIDFGELLVLVFRKIYIYILATILIFASIFIYNKLNKEEDTYNNYSEIYVADTSYIRKDDYTIKNSLGMTDAKKLIVSDQIINEVVKETNIEKKELLEKLKIESIDYSRIINVSIVTPDKSKGEKIINIITDKYVEFLKDDFNLTDSFVAGIGSEKIETGQKITGTLKKSILLAFVLASAFILVVYRKKYIFLERTNK